MAEPVEDYLGNRPLTRSRLMTGFIGNRGCQAPDGPVTILTTVGTGRSSNRADGVSDHLSLANYRQRSAAKRSEPSCVAYHFSATCSG